MKNPEDKILASICTNGHKFGNGKEICFKDKCPECGAEVGGYVLRVKINMKDWVGVVGSVGDGATIKKTKKKIK